jgi:hypothetical protein
MSSKNLFQVIPIQLWLSIFSFIHVTDKIGRKTHHSLNLVSKLAREITNHELIWQMRLCFGAIHFGFCFVGGNPSSHRELNQSDGLIGYLQQQEQERLNSLHQVKHPAVGRQKFSSAIEILSVFRKLKLRSTSTKSNPQFFSLDDAPISFCVFTPTLLARENVIIFSSWKSRFLYLYFLATLKCCVCTKTTVARLNDDSDLKKGLEFTFPRIFAEFLLGAQSSPEEKKNFNSFSSDEDETTVKREQLEMFYRSHSEHIFPWSGLRICEQCIAQLNLSFSSEEKGFERQMRRNRNDKEERQRLIPLGQVNLLPKDFVGVANTASNEKSKKNFAERTIIGTLFADLGNPRTVDGLSDPLGMIKFLNSQK